MAEFIVNPRRAPRAPARCRAAVLFPDGPFECETEDIGSRGCQIVAPRFVKRGAAVEIRVANGKLSQPLRARGKVAWVSSQSPWRVGVAFDEESVPEATRWFERLVAAHPGLGNFRRVPEKIAVEAMVYLGPPPRFLLDFTADEAVLLRAIASGARVDELQVRLRDRWPAAQRALFSLLARQAVTLSRGQAAHPDAWKRILTEVEASLAIESLGAGTTFSTPPAPVSRGGAESPAPTPAAAPRPTATPAPAAATVPLWSDPARERRVPLETARATPPLEIATPAPIQQRADRSTGGPTPTPPRPDFQGAGVGWRGKAPRARSVEAQGIYEQALGEIRASNLNGAIALLRKALALSPGDAEIAAELGRLAFKDRGGPA